MTNQPEIRLITVGELVDELIAARGYVLGSDEPYDLDKPAAIIAPSLRRKRSSFERCGEYGYTDDDHR